MIRTLTFIALGAAASAQTTTMPVEGPIQRYTLDYASGTLTKVGGPQRFELPRQEASTPAYVNDCFLFNFVSTGTTDELVDWGVKAAGASTLVDSFSIGYATDTLGPASGGPGATLEVAFYAGTTGFGVLGTEAARFTLSGLPGSVDGVNPNLFILDVTLPVGFCLPDGPIGYGFCSPDVGAIGTGPLLIDITDPLCSGNATIDAFDVFTCPAPTGPYVGTFNFSTLPNAASFYIEINEDDGATLASTAIDNGAGGNPVVATDGGVPPVINGTWPLSVDPVAAGYTMSAGFFGIGSYPPGTLFLGGGQEIIADISTFGPPIQVLQSPPGSDLYPLDIVCDVGLIGLPVTFQGIVFGGGLTPFALTNGVAGVVGF